MVVAQGKRRRLSAQDWTTAALDALATGGLAGVAVEPLAVQLGATKGSFYWHFADRDALLVAALAQWEREHTDDVIALVETEPDVPARLRLLLSLGLGVFGDHPDGNGVELALLATTRHPLVRPALARVSARRISYLAGLFVELGLAPVEAHRRGLLAYTAYLGHAQLVHATPELAPSGAALRRYVDEVTAMLTSGTEPLPNNGATAARDRRGRRGRPQP